MFTIPNAASAEDVTQAQPDSIDFSILVAAFGGTGVVTGCAVTAQASPNMTVAVAAGSVAIAGVQSSVTAGNVTLAAADPTNPRFSLIVAASGGALSAVAGTPAANPVFPAIPANSVVLAAVRVPAGAASINGPKITDKRVNAVLPAPTSFQSGMMMPWPTAVAPTGWQVCDGSLLNRTTNAALFAIIGTSYGAGDGSTTFAVPDLRGRAPVGFGGAAGHADVATLGNNENLAVAQRRQAHGHTLNLNLPNHVHSQALTLPDHGHGNNFTLPDHVHGNSFTLPNHGHANGLTLPNHGHSDNLSFSDTGHLHGVNDTGRFHTANSFQYTTTGGSYYFNVSSTGGGAVLDTVRTDVSGAAVNIQTAVANIAKSGAVGNPTSLPTINGTIGNPTSNPAISGSVGSITTSPAIVGSVGSITSSPAINGTIGNPTTQPVIPGTVGQGTANDEAAYLVVNFIIKL